jgi:hypothetical protein
MKLERKDPPRKFQAGTVTIADCGSLHLEPDEQVTLRTPMGGEFDVARKSWGYYATPSLNARLPSFGLRPVLARNTAGRFFVLLLETGRETEFDTYAAQEGLKVVCRLDDPGHLQRLEELFR